MIATITKITEELLESPEGKFLRGSSYNLPLFGLDLNEAYQRQLSEYILRIWILVGKQPGAYRYPCMEHYINEDELKKINAYWDYCVKNNKDYIEFEL